MTQFWIAIFFILLAISQLYRSLAAIDLPFTVYLVFGTVLAIAANPQQRFSFAPTQQVTLQEVTTPDPVLTTTAETAPVLTTTPTPEIAPAQVVETISAPQTAPVPAATNQPETAPTKVVKAKKPRTPKATPTSKTV